MPDGMTIEGYLIPERQSVIEGQRKPIWKRSCSPYRDQSRVKATSGGDAR